MLNLNRATIETANNLSQWNAGDALAREAEAVYLEGLQEMQPAGEMNDRQREIYTARAADWKQLVEKAYNDIIARRASWVPWSVCGPARYNAAKEGAKADRQAAAAAEWSEKLQRFVKNTADMIRDAVPVEQLLSQYRNGKRRDAIQADDPLALEKLTAKLEGMKERHETGKRWNAWFRKHGTMKGFPGMIDEDAANMDAVINSAPPFARAPYPSFSISNHNQEMKRISDRIEEIRRQRETGDEVQTFDGFTIKQEAGRINISFDTKPEPEARDILKTHGPHWSPRAMVWTRQNTDNALRAVRYYVIPGLQALNI